MNRPDAAQSRTFSALAVPNYRRYTWGQAISLIGTWMQTTAQSYLVYQITGSATDLGLTVALQTLPVLLLGPYGGVIADRVDKRKLMMALQSMMGVLALVLGIITVTHHVTIIEIYVLAVLLGLNNTFENPARQAFVLEMVGPKDLRNAVSLNSVLVNAARAVGPAFAGIIYDTAGPGVCFLINAVSFAAVVASLATMDVAKLSPSVPTHRSKGQLREGIAYVRRSPGLLYPLLMMALVGCLAYEFQVSLPVIAGNTFHGGSATYGFMTASMGVGAVIGGLFVAGRGRTGMRPMVVGALIFGIVITLAAASPVVAVEYAALALVGAASVAFLSMGNSTLQLSAAPEMRGRVMALWAVAFLGSTPIGGPVIGAVAEHFGGRAGLGVGAASCLLAAALGALAIRRVGRRQRSAAAGPAPAGSGTADIGPVAGGAAPVAVGGRA